MSGKYRLGPDNATLVVRTERGGAAAAAGHNLVIHVTSWDATLDLEDDPAASSMRLDADATSLRVQEGHGGVQPLGEDDKAEIHTTIDEEVLRRQDISFRSTRVRGGDDGHLSVSGDLTLAGETRPISFDLLVGEDGKLTARAVVSQTEWGIKPYSALFGALKVGDDVEVELEAQL